METNIKEVLASEEKATAIVAQAKQDADRIVAEARRASVDILAGGEREIRKEREKRITELRTKLDADKQGILAQQQTETAAVVNRARKNSDKAADFIVEKVRTHHA
jgi:vacuolar-type H+-ATPase subunit H